MKIGKVSSDYNNKLVDRLWDRLWGRLWDRLEDRLEDRIWNGTVKHKTNKGE